MHPSQELVAVFGAGGFIGHHLVRRLAAAGVRCRAVSRHPVESAALPGVEPVACDFLDPAATAAALRGATTVVQLISTSTPALRNEFVLDDIRENVIPQVRFLQQCIELGVGRYVFASSGGTVYGPDVPTPTREDAPTNPICSHGLTKLAIEKYIQMYGHVNGLEYRILRLANPYGPGQAFRKSQGLIPAILERQRMSLPVTVYGDGSALRDYIYIDDVIDAIASATLSGGSPRLVLNIGTGQARSVLDVIASIEAATGRPIEREWVPARTTDVGISMLDPTRARELLGWEPVTPFDDGVRRTVAAWLECQASSAS